MQVRRPSRLEPVALNGARRVRQWRDGETRQSQGRKVRPVPTTTERHGYLGSPIRVFLLIRGYRRPCSKVVSIAGRSSGKNPCKLLPLTLKDLGQLVGVRSPVAFQGENELVGWYGDV